MREAIGTDAQMAILGEGFRVPFGICHTKDCCPIVGVGTDGNLGIVDDFGGLIEVTPEQVPSLVSKLGLVTGLQVVVEQP